MEKFTANSCNLDLLRYLTALLCYLVEAPLIAIGVNISKEFMCREYTFQVKSHSAEGAALNGSEQPGEY